MFQDSKIAEKTIIYRQKTKKILDDVLVRGMKIQIIKHLQKKFSIMIDSTRDISNINQLLVCAQYFDESIGKICRVVFDLIPQGTGYFKVN
jgi:hypothetical protein